MGSAVLRRESAWIGAWEGGFCHLLKALGFTTVASFKEAWPEWARRAEAVEKDLAKKKGEVPRVKPWES